MNQPGHGVVTLEWGDGAHTFRLAWGAWFELQDKCGCGPAELLDRLLMRRWRACDLYEIIRLGLIGGGKSPADALVLARRYVQERPLMEAVTPALQIVSASLIGPPEKEDDKPGEAGVARDPEMGPSRSPPSTATVQ